MRHLARSKRKAARKAKRCSGCTAVHEPDSGHAFDFTLSVPDVEVKMVNAGSLSDYEVWLFLASASWSTATGFVVAFVQQAASKGAGAPVLLILALIFGTMFVVTFGQAIRLRRRMARTATTVRMHATEVGDR